VIDGYTQTNQKEYPVRTSLLAIGFCLIALFGCDSEAKPGASPDAAATTSASLPEIRYYVLSDA
jgi:hypothetical protein